MKIVQFYQILTRLTSRVNQNNKLIVCLEPRLGWSDRTIGTDLLTGASM